MSIEEKVKSLTLELGADFVGIASRSRFDGAPDFSDPKNLLPDFRSVIAFGIAMNLGSLEAWFSKRNRRPQVLMDRWTLHQLEQISSHLSHWLERQGFKSVFVAQNGYYNFYRGEPDFSHKHAAVAAGLGKLGLSSIFVHTQFGGAVHLCSVITEAELAPDPMVGDEFDPCLDCKICIDICPTKAIARDRTVSLIMEGREYSHQLVNKPVCIWGCAGLAGHQYQMNGRTVGTWAYNDLPVPYKGVVPTADDRRQPDISGSLRLRRHPMEVAEILLTPEHIKTGTEYCGNCQKICVGTIEDCRALLELHLNSGVVKIPEDPTLLSYLKAANTQLEPYPIPSEQA